MELLSATLRIHTGKWEKAVFSIWTNPSGSLHKLLDLNLREATKPSKTSNWVGRQILQQGIQQEEVSSDDAHFSFGADT